MEETKLFSASSPDLYTELDPTHSSTWDKALDNPGLEQSKWA